MAHAVAESFRRAATPLFWYYVMTVAVPLLNGAAANGRAFAEHLLFLLVLPPVVIIAAGASRAIVQGIVTKVRE